MRLVKLLFSSWLFIILAACNTNDEATVKVILDSKVPLDSLSSGSGIVYANSHYYIIGDDSPWLYKVTETMKTSKWVKLSEIDSTVDGRTPKAIKADFECMESMTLDDLEYLVFLSSVSTRKTRDTAIIFNLKDEQVIAKKNIRPFLEKIKDEAAIPAFEIYRFHLPELEGSRAGFSGACMMPGNTSIIFTASVEKTVDVYNDGTITGSYIGVIPLNGLKDGKFMADLLLEDGNILTKKLEGVAVINATDNKYYQLLVTDNDDGTSDLVKVQLVIN